MIPDNLIIVKAILLAFALCSINAFAEDWTTTDGTKYQKVQVIRVEDDAITILYKDGGALIFLNKLSPLLQQRFNYDPVKAKAAAEARVKADAENAKELQAEIVLADKLKREQQIKYAQSLTNAAPK
jgi:nicotinate-nucleotide pyrophosphorylase